MKTHSYFFIFPVIILSLLCTVSIAATSSQNNTPDFSTIKDIKTRKQAFFDFMSPFIQNLNNKLANERQQLNTIINSINTGKALSPASIKKLKSWSAQYEIEFNETNIKSTAQALLLHIDEIPASMVLAQAAIESAWGTSRFAKQGNNYFGQWCYKKGCGIVPAARQQGTKHEVKKFRSAKDSVSSYFRNINSHHAYKIVREIRMDLRKSGKQLSGLKLVEGLKKYSQRGSDYIKELQSMIRYNKLEKRNQY